MLLNSSSISASVILLPSILFEEPTDSIVATRFITFNSAGVKFNAPACQEPINWSISAILFNISGVIVMSFILGILPLFTLPNITRYYQISQEIVPRYTKNHYQILPDNDILFTRYFFIFLQNYSFSITFDFIQAHFLNFILFSGALFQNFFPVQTLTCAFRFQSR